MTLFLILSTKGEGRDLKIRFRGDGKYRNPSSKSRDGARNPVKVDMTGEKVNWIDLYMQERALELAAVPTNVR